MDGKRLKERIIAESLLLGIDKVGFTTAKDFSELEDSLKEQRKRGFTTGFEHPNIHERLYPTKIFNYPKSLISIALAYPTKLKKKGDSTKGKRGKISRSSWGVDYHKILKHKMLLLIEKIKELVTEEELDFRLMVDTGELVDVAVAKRSGIGFIGKNGLMITEEFGSFVYLGEILTNLDLPSDRPRENQCGDCRRCLDNCPTKALLGDGRMNAKRCLSYQTQLKGNISKEFRRYMRTTIYGCDICQLVCPFNKGKDFHFHSLMEPSIEDVEPLLKPLLTITNREFRERFGYMAASWRGRKPLQRNAIIALANHHDISAIPDLLNVMENSSVAMIRGMAAWGLGELISTPSSKVKQRVFRAMDKETELETIQEFVGVLEKWDVK
ncbi:MAG: tRNA epoxyqueuosine(34) reductase QueG [Lactobacillales bacterium]|nr:tRNA epoxyqueuosine(34) reductase QueG [Lactobacillales bacterium]